MNLIKALLSHQYDAVQQSVCAYILPDDVAVKLQAIHNLLAMDKLKLIICSDNDVSCNVSIDESTLNYLIQSSNEYIPFIPSMCDMLYTHMETHSLDTIVVKLKSGDTITCDLKWEQGNGNNYYFYNEYLGVRISIDNVVGYKFV